MISRSGLLTKIQCDDILFFLFRMVIVLVKESREEISGKFETWRHPLENT